MRGGPVLRVAIAGGSIGGLTAAVLLRDLGHQVDVLERSGSELQARGAGIVVHEVSVRYLVDNGLADIDALSVASHHHVHVDAAGEIVHHDPSTYRYTSWQTLYRNLLRSFGTDRYRLGVAVSGFEDRGGEVVVETTSGEIECDLLICFDGVASTARSVLRPAVQPHYAGYVGWRGTVPEAALSSRSTAMLEDRLVYHHAGNSHILAYLIPGGEGQLPPEHGRHGRRERALDLGPRLVNFVWYRNVEAGELTQLMTDQAGAEHSLSLPPGSVRQPYLEELHAAARRLPPVFAELVLATAEPFIQKIVDVEVDRMAFGRICLAGDAAFTARPHTAAGTAKAAADAWALAGAVRDHGEAPVALRTWEAGQLALGRQLVARARQLGKRSQFRGSWCPADPYQRFGLWEPGDSRLEHGPGSI